jgi:hypothetical protein
MRTGGQQLGGGLRRGLCAGLVQVAGLGQCPIGAPAVGPHGAARLDRRAGGLGQGLGAGVVDDAQVGAAEAAARRLLGADCDQGPCAARRVRASRCRARGHRAATRRARPRRAAAARAAAAPGLRDPAAQQPRGLACHAQLAGELGRRGRLLHRGRQPDRRQPAHWQEPAAAQMPGHLVSAARTAEALPPALLEERPPAGVLASDTSPWNPPASANDPLTTPPSGTVCTREDRVPTGRKGMVSQAFCG